MFNKYLPSLINYDKNMCYNTENLYFNHFYPWSEMTKSII